MAAVLNTFGVSGWVDAQVDRDWQWGQTDCTIAVADYVLALTGRDPAGPLRGRYSTAIGAQRAWRRGGGYLPLIRANMERCGFIETMSPVSGDVGIVRATSRFEQSLPVIGTVAAVRIGTLWAVRAGAGVMAQDFEPLASWDMSAWTRS